MIIMLTGPSGAGKGSIWDKFCELGLDKKYGLERVITTTTREKREGEVHGETYYFTDVGSFQHKIENKELVEYANVYGNFYGSTFDELQRIINDGKKVFYEVDPQGVKNLKETLKNDYDIYTIFILPPSKEELKNRLVGRGTEKEEDLQIRLDEAEKQMEEKHIYDYNLVNEDLKKSVEEFEKIIKSLN